MVTDFNHLYISSVGSGAYGLFWSIFGYTDPQSFQTKDPNFTITRETGVFLFGLFQILAVIVAVNMLIAMMTKSFENITVRNAYSNNKKSSSMMGSKLIMDINVILTRCTCIYIQYSMRATVTSQVEFCEGEKGESSWYGRKQQINKKEINSHMVLTQCTGIAPPTRLVELTAVKVECFTAAPLTLANP